MRLYGRLADVSGGRLTFAADLAEHLDAADPVCESIKDPIDQYVAARGIAAPAERRTPPVWRPAWEPRSLDVDAAGIGAVVWCTGYRSDYRWVDVPMFDGRGYPRHDRGVTSAAGLYVLGLPWLHTWGSGRFSGVGRDADHLIGLSAPGPTRRSWPDPAVLPSLRDQGHIVS